MAARLRLLDLLIQALALVATIIAAVVVCAFGLIHGDLMRAVLGAVAGWLVAGISRHWLIGVIEYMDELGL